VRFAITQVAEGDYQFSLTYADLEIAMAIDKRQSIAVWESNLHEPTLERSADARSELATAMRIIVPTIEAWALGSTSDQWGLKMFLYRSLNTSELLLAEEAKGEVIPAALTLWSPRAGSYQYFDCHVCAAHDTGHGTLRGGRAEPEWCYLSSSGCNACEASWGPSECPGRCGLGCGSDSNSGAGSYTLNCLAHDGGAGSWQHAANDWAWGAMNCWTTDDDYCCCPEDEGDCDLADEVCDGACWL
jgi:hypothetical protein